MRVGDGGIADLRVPGGDRQLTGQQRGARLVSRIADLQEVTALGFGHRRHGPVVDDQQVDPPESVQSSLEWLPSARATARSRNSSAAFRKSAV